MPLSVVDRIAFGSDSTSGSPNSNRVDAETQAKILAAIHARVPMVTPDEQRTVQLENAEPTSAFGRAFTTCTRAPSRITRT